MILFLTPFELIKKDYSDFSFENESIWEEQNSRTKINTSKIFEFLKDFQPLTDTYFSKGDLKFRTEISYSNFNYSVYYKYKIELNGEKILEKIESLSKSKNLYNYFYYKGRNINKPIIIYHPKNPTIFLKFGNEEFITIVYNEEIYFKILKNDQNI